MHYFSKQLEGHWWFRAGRWGDMGLVQTPASPLMTLQPDTFFHLRASQGTAHVNELLRTAAWDITGPQNISTWSLC